MPLSVLIESMYQAAVLPDRWPAVLDALCRISGSASSSLLVADGESPPPWQATARTRDLLQELSGTDAWRAPQRGADHLLSQDSGGGRFHCVNDLMPRHELEADAVYRAFLRLGLSWQVGMAIPLSRGSTMILTLERDAGSGRHSADQLALLTPLWGHLAQAGRIACGLSQARARGALDGLAAFGLSAVLLDRHGRLLDSNPPPSGGWNGWISLRADGRIKLGDAAGEALLESILRKETGLRPIVLPAVPARPRRVVHLIPLPGEARELFGGGLWLLTIHVSGAAARAPGTHLLRTLYDLSAAESQLAAKLATGATLAVAAMQCGIRPSTARSYLEQVFHKTGCHRQAELVALLGGITRMTTSNASD